jgi:hypothetical protein
MSIVPMHPDYFSVMAIESLANVLPKWKTWADAARALPLLREAEYPFPNVTPMFLGYVIQKYRPRGGGVPSAAFQQWIDQVVGDVADKLIPAIGAAGMMLDQKRYQDAGFEPYLPLLQMSDFNSLIALSQKHQVPIFELADEQLEQVGVVLEKTKKSMDGFKALYSEAADRVLKLI